MSRVVLNPAILAQLLDHNQLVEVCDGTGQVVGHFVPAVQPSRPDERGPRIDEEEMERRESAGGGRSLRAILADLEKRA